MDYVELGRVLRRIRKEKGMKIKDLQDNNISIATISNVERGVENVKNEIREYYCRKLGVNPSMIDELIKEEKEHHKKIENELLLLESRISLGLFKEAKQKMRELSSKYESLFPADFHYLKGKYYYGRNNERSKKHFLETIRIVEEDRNLNQTNLKASALKDLGRIAFYHEQNINQALQYVDEGLRCFDPNGKRKEMKHYLLISKVLYLEKLGRVDSALDTLKELELSAGEIKDLDIKLNMLEMKALLLNYKKKYQQALEFALEAFKISADNHKHERSVELLNTLGIITKNMKEPNKAKDYFLMAMELENSIHKKYLMITTYTKLGELYIETGEHEKAESILKLAVAKGSKSNDFIRYCDALIILGKYFMECENNYSEAIKVLNEAHDIAIKHKLDDLRQKIILALCECYDQIDLKEKSLALMTELRLLLKQE